MSATQRSWVEQAQSDTFKRNDAQTIQRATLEENHDYTEVLDISAANKLGFDSLDKISSDSLLMYICSSNDDAVRGFPGGMRATASITFGVPATNDTVVINGTTCTKVAAGPGANEFVTIAQLEVLADAIANIDSSASATAVSLAAAAGGTAGNAYTLALGGGNTGSMAISGATFAGGAATDEWGDEYKLSTGTNPFDANNAQTGPLSAFGYCGLLILRDGEADGDIIIAAAIAN